MGKRSTLIAAVTVAVLAISGVAYATVVDSSGVIHGCVTNAAVNGSHALVVQDTGTSCPKGTSALNWNQAGSGGASTAGPSGLDVVQRRATGTGSVEVDCDPIVKTNGVITQVGNSYVTGGGGAISDGTGSLTQSDETGRGSGQSNGTTTVFTSVDGWSVTSSNDSDQVTATVFCSK